MKKKNKRVFWSKAAPPVTELWFKESSFIDVGEFHGFPKGKDEYMHIDTIWYYPEFDILLIKTFECLFYENYRGDLLVIDLPSPRKVPDKLIYIGVFYVPRQIRHEFFLSCGGAEQSDSGADEYFDRGDFEVKREERKPRDRIERLKRNHFPERMPDDPIFEGEWIKKFLE